jgi:hypothetical protein
LTTNVHLPSEIENRDSESIGSLSTSMILPVRESVSSSNTCPYTYKGHHIKYSSLTLIIHPHVRSRVKNNVENGHLGRMKIAQDKYI